MIVNYTGLHWFCFKWRGLGPNTTPTTNRRKGEALVCNTLAWHRNGNECKPGDGIPDAELRVEFS